MAKRLPLLIALVAAATALALPAGASACSCAPVKLDREAFRQADAALVGRLVERRELSERRTEYRFRALRVFRGKRRIAKGEIVGVRSFSDGVSCGIETPMGKREGLFLTRSRHHWVGSLCATAPPRKMIRAAERHGFARTRSC